MEGYIAFYFLHGLVNVSVEDRYRAEAFEIAESLRAVFGAPAPVGIDRPERDVGEHDDGRAVLEVLHVGFEPLELLLAKRAEAASFQVGDVDKSDEVDAFLLEAIPARSFAGFAEALQILLALVADEIVLAGDVKDVGGLRRLDELFDVVELGGLARWLMSPVCRMNSGAIGSALILSMAALKVPITSALAGLSNPMWLSLIWTKARSPLCSLTFESPPRPRA